MASSSSTKSAPVLKKVDGKAPTITTIPSVFTAPQASPLYAQQTADVPAEFTDDSYTANVDWQAGVDGSGAFKVNPSSGLASGRRVGWSLRDSSGKVLAFFGFTINPQSITNAPSNRSTLYATKGALYVNSFGPGSTQIVLSQTVGSGGIDGAGQIYAAREDVLQFLALYGQATTIPPGGGALPAVWFHDQHLDQTSGSSGQQVYFPTNAVTFSRSVTQQNVWLVTVTMGTLTENPDGAYQQETANTAAAAKQTYRYTCVDGDTLTRIAQKAIKHDIHEHKYALATMIALIKRLNPDFAQKRTYKVSGVTHTASAFHPYPGEVLAMPR
jgi:hypothetical protein